VFDAMLAHAARLCEANFAFVMLQEDGRLGLAARGALYGSSATLDGP
jgi:hypothetical protein